MNKWGKRLLWSMIGLTGSFVLAQVVRSQSTAPPGLQGVTPTDRLNEPRWVTRHKAILQSLPAHRDTQVVFLGDSITQNYEGRNPPYHDYAPIWDYYYGDRRALNLGFSGDTTGELLWRLDHGEVEGLRPAVAVILIGTNNTGHGQTVEETQAGIEAVVAKTEEKLPKARILLLGILPSQLTDKKTAADLAVNAGLATRYASGAGPVTWLDIGDAFRKDGQLDVSLYGEPLQNPPRKPLHPNTDGQRRLAAAVEPALARLLGTAPKPEMPAQQP